MKTRFFLIVSVALMTLCFTLRQEPWTKEQLIEPATLAAIIKDPKTKKPVIYNIGPSGKIRGSIEIGPGRDPENIEKLKALLSKLPKETEIVIYCGCCPFKDCPNIRPPFQLLNKMGFKNHKLLNLPRNLKVDWIDKGYPMNS